MQTVLGLQRQGWPRCRPGLTWVDEEVTAELAGRTEEEAPLPQVPVDAVAQFVGRPAGVRPVLGLHTPV